MPPENIPTSLSNPGDLTFAGQSGATPTTVQTSTGPKTMAGFANPTAGLTALQDQIQLNVKNKPQESLEDWVGNYAPASDGNNVGEYTANLATDLGVPPNTPIGTLSSKIGPWTAGVANQEGFQMSNNSSNSNGGNAALDTVGAGIGAVGGLLKDVAPELPTIGGAVGAVVGTPFDALTGPAGTAVGLAGGTAIGEGAEGLINDLTGGSSGSSGSSTSSDTSGATQPQDTSETFPGESQSDLAPVASSFNDALGTTVGGNNVLYEANNRDIPDLGMAAAQMGVIPQADENGNYDKMSPALILNAGNSQDANTENEAAQGMTSQTSLADAMAFSQGEAKKRMKNHPDLDATLGKIQKTFEGYSRQHSQQKDKNGNPLNMSQQFVDAPTLLDMARKASSGENWATPSYERSASQHIKSALKGHFVKLSEGEGIKGMKETEKRMETRFLLKKAIKALPKKASRNKRKELFKEIAGALGGAVIGKTLGNGLIGGIAGGLLERRLGKKEYKQMGNKKQRGLLQKNAQTPAKSLIYRSAQ